MKPFLPPVLTLCALLAFSVWNCRTIMLSANHWCAQIENAAGLASEEDWPAAREALEESYRDWSGYQTYLHVVENHDAVDDAEAMYRRAAAFAAEEESSEFQAETADLKDQLRLLAEQERFSVENIF